MADYAARTQDGYLTKTGPVGSGYTNVLNSYSPTANTSAVYAIVGQNNSGVDYYIMRAYLSFDTTALVAGASAASMTVALSLDNSSTDFDVRLYYKAQPTWGGTLDTGDWGTGTTGPTVCFNTAGKTIDSYITFEIPPEALNPGGITEFELRSSREGTTPSGPELVRIYTAETTTYKPYLSVTFGGSDDQMDQDGATVVLFCV